MNADQGDIAACLPCLWSVLSFYELSLRDRNEGIGSPLLTRGPAHMNLGYPHHPFDYSFRSFFKGGIRNNPIIPWDTKAGQCLVSGQVMI